VRDDRNRRTERKKRRKRANVEEKRGKKAMRLHTEKLTFPRKGNPSVIKTMLSRRQAERGGEAFRDTKQSDHHLPRG
jgi:hypothetical protein